MWPTGVCQIVRSSATTSRRRGAVRARETGAVDDPRMQPVALGDRSRDDASARGDRALVREAHTQLLGQTAQRTGHPRGRSSDRSAPTAAVKLTIASLRRATRRAGGDLRGIGPDAGRTHRQRQLPGSERRRREAARRRAVIDRRSRSAGRRSRGGRARTRSRARRGAESNSDSSANTLPRDLADPAGAQLAGELRRGRAVAELPDAVERAVAERRIAAAAQVEVAVPDAAGDRGARSRSRSCAGGSRWRASTAARSSCRASRPTPAGA